MQLFGLSRRRRRGGGGFDPSGLFANGEAGVWYDPSDLTPEKLAWVAANPGFTSAQFLDAFPTHTLYQNSTGTTPVTALGQSVGLVLDKSRNLTGASLPLGRRNLLTYSEQFDNAAWAKSDSTVTANTIVAPDGTLTGDKLVDTTSNTGHSLSQAQAMTSGASYTASVFAKRGEIQYVFLRFLSGGAFAANHIAIFDLLNGTASNSSTLPVTSFSITAVGNEWYRCSITQAATSTANGTFGVYLSNDGVNSTYAGNGVDGAYLWGAQLELGTTASTYQPVTDTWYNAIPGNHAIQTTSASRPTLQARTNFNVTSQITAGSGNSVTSNIATAPDGTNRAERVTKTDATATVYASQNYITSFAMNNTTYVASRYFKYDGFNTTVSLEYNNGSNWGNSWVAVFTVTSTGITVSSQFGCVATVTDVGNGWYRCTARFTTTTITLAGSTYLIQITGASGVSVQTFGGQLELGTTASAFQFVSSATSYADVWAPRNLTFDGTDDSLVTAASVNFSGTDKMTVCAGVFKASDATFAPVVETSATSSTTNGAFAVFAPYSNTEQNYGLNSRGTSLVSIAGPASGAGALPAPNTSVLSMLTDISGPSALMRQNGATYISSVNSQGTGNYASHLLFIGRRNNATSPLNGRLYQLIVRGAATDSVTVINTERYVAQKTGVTL